MTVAAVVVLLLNSLGMLAEPSALLYVVALEMALGIATSNFVTIALQRLL